MSKQDQKMVITKEQLLKVGGGRCLPSFRCGVWKKRSKYIGSRQAIKEWKC